MEQKFIEWVASLSKKYRQAQIKSFIQINYDLCKFRLDLGKEIEETSFRNKYGKQFFILLSKEFEKNIPDSHGFSSRNLRYFQSFYILYRKILQQLVAKFIPLLADDEKLETEDVEKIILTKFASVPWGHHTIILDQFVNKPEEAWFYILKTIENNWSRSTLGLFISSDLYEREGKAINNFALTLPKENSDLVKELTKDPYIFDFAEMHNDYNEKEIKKNVVDKIETSLLEIGKGFSFVGKEYRLDVGESEFYIDLLLYYIPEHFYVVVEFKNTKFKPEYLGQLSFYVSAIDHQLKGDKDNKTIGMLICKDKDNIVAQYSVENYNIPMGISSFDLSK